MKKQNKLKHKKVLLHESLTKNYKTYIWLCTASDEFALIATATLCPLFFGRRMLIVTDNPLHSFDSKPYYDYSQDIACIFLCTAVIIAVGMPWFLPCCWLMLGSHLSFSEQVDYGMPPRLLLDVVRWVILVLFEIPGRREQSSKSKLVELRCIHSPLQLCCGKFQWSYFRFCIAILWGSELEVPWVVLSCR